MTRRVFGLLALLCLGSAVGEAQDAPHQNRRDIDVVHYDFTVSLPVSGPMDSIDVNERVSFKRTGGADSLVLDLADGMVVLDASVNGRRTPFVRGRQVVRIPLPAGVQDSLEVAIHYQGKPRDGLIMRSDAMGRWTAFADNYPDRAREWLATVDHPSDKATVQWTVRHPASTRVIANGALLEESPEAGTDATLTRWRSVRPLYTAVMVIGVAPFAVYELGDTACALAELPGCVRQSVWVAPEVRPSMPGAFSHAGAIVELFSRLVAPFPYEKLAHVQSFTRWGGMENAAAIFYADAAFRRASGVNEGTIAHEIAHQWFGDAVTEREWRDVWLSEGFATYFAALWTEHSEGDSAFRAGLARMRDQVLEAPITLQEPVVRDSVPDLSKLLNSNVYQKAGFTLHMLRREIGDSAFFRGIRSYYVKYRHANAATADLVRELETASGKSLGSFFEQWMRRPGFADLTVAWQWNVAQKALLLTVEQSTAAPYRVGLGVDVTDAAGRVHHVRVTVPEQRESTVKIPLSFNTAPSKVEFDRDVSLLGRITLKR